MPFKACLRVFPCMSCTKCRLLDEIKWVLSSLVSNFQRNPSKFFSFTIFRDGPTGAGQKETETAIITKVSNQSASESQSKGIMHTSLLSLSLPRVLYLLSDMAAESFLHPFYHHDPLSQTQKKYILICQGQVGELEKDILLSSADPNAHHFQASAHLHPFAQNAKRPKKRDREEKHKREEEKRTLVWLRLRGTGSVPKIAGTKAENMISLFGISCICVFISQGDHFAFLAYRSFRAQRTNQFLEGMFFFL